jgi:hypothetical protein
MPENLKSSFQYRYVCTRGECGCEKLVYYIGSEAHYLYDRAGQITNHCPECYGDVLLNQQTIDQ